MRRPFGSIFDKPYRTVSPPQARTAVAAGAILLDVREADEWAATDQGLDTSNLKGGMSAWAAAGLPVVARGGRPGRIT